MSASSAPVRTVRAPDAVDPTVEARVLEERARWAMRIHDGLTQTVTSAVLELQTLRTRILADPAGAVASLSGVEAAIRADLREVRQMLFELYEDQRPPEPPLATIHRRVARALGTPRSRVDRRRCGRGAAERCWRPRTPCSPSRSRTPRSTRGRTDVSVQVDAGETSDADHGRGPRSRHPGRRGRRSAFRAQHDAGPRRGYRWNPGDRIDARGRDPRGRAPSRRRARRGTMRILIVDDHALVRRGMSLCREGRVPRRRRRGSRGRQRGARRDAEQGRRSRARRRPDAGPRRSGAAARDEARVAGRPGDHAVDLRERAVREARAGGRCRRATC